MNRLHHRPAVGRPVLLDVRVIDFTDAAFVLVYKVYKRGRRLLRSNVTCRSGTIRRASRQAKHAVMSKQWQRIGEMFDDCGWR